MHRADALSVCGDIEEVNSEKAVELKALKDHAATLITELRQAAAGVARAGPSVAGSSRGVESEDALKTQPPPRTEGWVEFRRSGLGMASWMWPVRARAPWLTDGGREAWAGGAAREEDMQAHAKRKHKRRAWGVGRIAWLLLALLLLGAAMWAVWRRGLLPWGTAALQGAQAEVAVEVADTALCSAMDGPARCTTSR